MAKQKRSSVGIISVEKPTWWPNVSYESGEVDHDSVVSIGTAVSINPTLNSETTQDYGDGVVQDQFTAFGGAEITLVTNGYKNATLAALTGSKMVGGGILRSADDIAPDGAFAYRRKKSNGAYRYTVFYKGQFALTGDESTTQEGSTVTFTHPEWTGSFVDVPGLGYMYSVDSDDEGVDQTVLENWFTIPQMPKDKDITEGDDE